MRSARKATAGSGRTRSSARSRAALLRAMRRCWGPRRRGSELAGVTGHWLPCSSPSCCASHFRIPWASNDLLGSSFTALPFVFCFFSHPLRDLFAFSDREPPHWLTDCPCHGLFQPFCSASMFLCQSWSWQERKPDCFSLFPSVWILEWEWFIVSLDKHDPNSSLVERLYNFFR